MWPHSFSPILSLQILDFKAKYVSSPTALIDHFCSVSALYHGGIGSVYDISHFRGRRIELGYIPSAESDQK